MFEVLFEILGELIANLLVEWAVGNVAFRITRGGLYTLAIFIAACGFGWASTALVARPLIPWTAVRVAYVIAVPPLVATAIAKLAERRERKGKPPGVIGNWADAYFFALGFSLTRFCATYVIY